MKKEENEFKKTIFELMNGLLNLESYPVTESKYVANEFEEGKFCDIAYEEVYNANRRLCQRLGVEEDQDIETIINNLLDISEYLCYKMYDYGSFFSPSMRYS